MADYDDPFAEPGDTDKTVIRPNPGGRRTATPVQQPETPQVQPGSEQPAEPGLDAYGVPQAAAPKQQAAAGGAKAPKMALTGMNQLTACASTLFALISRIRNRAQHMDPDGLRKNVVAEVRAFEKLQKRMRDLAKDKGMMATT